MPAVKRKTLRTRTEYTDHEVESLLTGHCFFSDRPGWTLHDGREPELERQAKAEKRELWEHVKEELLAEWIAENPGTRPWGWWEFDAPERRRRIDGKPHPFENPEREDMIRRLHTVDGKPRPHCHKLYYGRPGSLFHEDDFGAQYESDAQYLTRLNLLTDDERAALSNPDTPPEGE